MFCDRQLGEAGIGDEQGAGDAGGPAGIGKFLDAARAEADGSRVAPIGGRCAHVAVPG